MSEIDKVIETLKKMQEVSQREVYRYMIDDLKKAQAENLKLKQLVEFAYIPIFDLPRNKHTQDWLEKAKEAMK